MDKHPPAARATEATTLEQQIMEARFPKNEREWWAKREIERLRAEIEKMRREHPHNVRTEVSKCGRRNENG